MDVVLELRPGLWERLLSHLLPSGNRLEQSAFIFATQSQGEGQLRLAECEHYALSDGDFDEQAEQYLEITDDCKQRLIKRAHELGACLVEMHSHPGPWPAAFSGYDRQGLAETAPHMLWRLKGRPYVALVVAPSGFDALVWLTREARPIALSELRATPSVLRPTNRSLGGW